MKQLPRLYLPDATEGATIRLTATQHHHLTRVLRLENEAPVRVFDGSGREFNARLAFGTRRAGAVLNECVHEEAEPVLAVTLVVAISRAIRMEWALEKAVELGVADIRPALAERGKVRLSGERAERRQSHWQGVIVSAAAQCGRARLPRLSAPAGLSETLETLEAIPTRNKIALLPDATRPLPTLAPPEGEVALLVGPESGFSPREAALIHASGWQAARLGPRILRAETAVPAALAAVQALWGDWRN
jgi:16S rRNA (uracil1498-N3)-methyltransferase